MWLMNRSGDACLKIVKMAVKTYQRTAVFIGSHVSTRHRERVGASVSPRLIPVLKCIV